MEAVGVAAGVASVASIARWIAVPWLRSNAKDLSEDATIDGSDEDGLQGLKVEHDPKSPEVDICFVHGLTGDARSTWTAQSKDTGQDVFWPTDLLTNTNALNENAFPQARIMLYGYETDVNSLCWLTERTLYHHGKRFLRMLTEKRAHCKHRPLLFVAHSLGGLLVKSSLIFARNVKSTSITDEREIYLSTFGVISFGTPQIFTGKTSMSLSDVVDRICQLRASTFEDSDSSTWENDVRNLETRLGRYKDIAKDIPEVFCYESSRTNGSYVPLCTRRILPPKQDVHEFCEFVSIEADHINMCKFTSSSRQYRRIEELIRKLFDLSSSLLGKRRERYAKTHQSTITLPRRALDFGFAVDPELPPRGRFVPRTDIVSRQDYLDVLDQRLRNTRFAVLTGPHGHGKTSLAREYAWLRSEEKQERSFKSIFWLDAASELTLEVSFIKAIRQLRRYYGRDIIRQTDRDPESEIIHVLDSIKATEDDVPLRKEDRRYAIRAFMDWLSFPENKDWLLIYDDAEELHAPYLQGFLPPIEPQRGYIIMTSREDHTKDYESLEGQISVEPFKRTYSAMSSSPVAGSVSRFTVSTSRAATSEAIESSNSSSHPHLTRESASEQLHFLGPSAMDRPQSTRSGSVRRFAHIRVGSFPLEDPMETSQTFHDRGRSPPPEGGNLTSV
jgi:hypothetical protein